VPTALPRRLATVALATLLLLAVAVPASAHVTLRTDNPAAGGFAVYTIRVPNERDDAATTQVEVRMPDGFEASRYRPADGWDIAIEDGVMTIGGGRIEPGQYEDFSFQARNPEEAGVLVFPAIQTYDSGEVVEWVGAEDADTPAARVELVPGGGDGHGGDGHGSEDAAEAAEADAEAADAEAADAEPVAADGGSGGALPVVALVLSLVAVGLGGLALTRGRRA
jgi:uncharacterized protein YcnI